MRRWGVFVFSFLFVFVVFFSFCICLCHRGSPTANQRQGMVLARWGFIAGAFSKSEDFSLFEHFQSLKTNITRNNIRIEIKYTHIVLFIGTPSYPFWHLLGAGNSQIPPTDRDDEDTAWWTLFFRNIALLIYQISMMQKSFKTSPSHQVDVRILLLILIRSPTGRSGDRQPDNFEGVRQFFFSSIFIYMIIGGK